MQKTSDKVIDFVIDFESLGFQPDGVVLDFAAIPFVYEDPTEVRPTAETVHMLREKAFYAKLKVSAQTDRFIDKPVVDWWDKQDEAVKGILEESEEDIALNEFFHCFIHWFEEVGGNFWKSQMWSRGNEFDFGMMTDIWRKETGLRDTYNTLPYAFWKVRDIRTAVERSMGVRDMCTVPIPKGIFPDFRPHNSVDDCIMGVLHLIFSERYSYGIEEIPWDNYDENSYKPKKGNK